MGVLLRCLTEVCARPTPPARAGPGLRPGVKPRIIVRRLRGWDELVRWYGSGSWALRNSALALLVTRVGLADDHDAAVPPDDPAVVADPLDARLDLHGYALTLSQTGLGKAPATLYL